MSTRKAFAIGALGFGVALLVVIAALTGAILSRGFYSLLPVALFIGLANVGNIMLSLHIIKQEDEEEKKNNDTIKSV